MWHNRHARGKRSTRVLGLSAGPFAVAAAETASSVQRQQDTDANWLAMRWSLVVGFGMLVGKVSAYVITGSAAILSDAAESVIHVIAVGFAAFSLRLSARPGGFALPVRLRAHRVLLGGLRGRADHPGGRSRSSSRRPPSGCRAWSSSSWVGHLDRRLRRGAERGARLLPGANGPPDRLIILEANGKHVLTDSWTSVGVVEGCCS